MSEPNPNRVLSVLGSSAGIDDELSTWLQEQSRDVGAPVPIIAVAVLRDYMRCANACKAERDSAKKLN
jgi:hypothetical protein